MNILVLATDYPRLDGSVASFFIHSRNKCYIKNGIDVSVISFRAEGDYEIDGVKVYTLKTYQNKLKDIQYDIVLSHASNLKDHYRFLKKHSNKFSNIIFYFHGHEVLRTSQIYPKPYEFSAKQPIIKKIISDTYDMFKLRVWRKYFKEISYKSQFIFVSNWMYDMFIKFIKIEPNLIEDKKHIIYNCIGENFENVEYDQLRDKKYDFITIRSNLDGSKYGIDIVTKLAKTNPQYEFCVVGKGKFYDYNEKPSNLTWINKNLSHDEIISYLNDSRCALLPTRTDAQGVMACEIATFGIPLITSDIAVCREVFEGFENVAFINNDKSDIDITPIFEKLLAVDAKSKNTKYFLNNTVLKEVELFQKLNG